MNSRLIAVIVAIGVSVGASPSISAATKVKRCDFSALPALDCVLRLTATESGQEAKIEPQQWLIISTQGGIEACPIRRLQVSVSGSGRQGSAKGSPRVAVESKVRFIKPKDGGLLRTAGTVTAGMSVDEDITRDFSPPACKFILEVRGFARQIPLAGARPLFRSTTIAVEIHTMMTM